MSFGFAIGDIVALGNLAWNLYKQCKNASAEFKEVQNEVLSLHAAVKELQDEAENEESILNRAGLGRKKELIDNIQNCTEVLAQLEDLLTRFNSLGTKRKKVFDVLKFGSQGLQEIRQKLMLHTSSLTLFLTRLGTGSLGRIEKKLDDIAADIRAARHEPSLSSVCVDNDVIEQDSAWHILMKELSDDFAPEDIEAHKSEIKAYIRRLIERGDLHEQVPFARLDEAAAPTSKSSSEDSLGPSASASEPKGKPPPHRPLWPPKPTVESVIGLGSNLSQDQGGATARNISEHRPKLAVLSVMD